MSATVKPLNLYDLLAPQFLAGFQFPDYIDEYLSLLAVADLQMASDDDAILYAGTVFFPNKPGSPPVLAHRPPSGALFDFHDLTLRFRLRIPRAGSAKVQSLINAGGNSIQSLKDATDAFGTPGATPTDYPGVAFELELLLTFLTFHLPKSWKPALYNPTSYEVTLDPAPAHDDVRIVLPKGIFTYSQGQDFSKPPDFRLNSWGDAGFDAPHDLAEGESVTMDPPLAIHSSGRIAFGVDDVILDLSPDGTPPEILAHFGTDEGFEGIFVKALQVYYCDRNKDTALNFMVKDALISFKGEVSLEAEIDLMLPDKAFGVTIRIYDGRKKLPCDPGHGSTVGATSTWLGGNAKMTPNGVLYLQVAGGTPPFKYSAQFAGRELWSGTERRASLTQFLPMSDQSDTLVIEVTDSSVPPQIYTNALTLNIVNPPADAAEVAAGSPGPALWTADSRPAGIPVEDMIQFIPATSGTLETLTIAGGTTLPIVTVDNVNHALNASRQVVVDVPVGAQVPIIVAYPATTLPGMFPVFFAFGEPASDALESNYYGTNGGAPDPPTVPNDDVFQTNRAPDGVPGGSGFGGAPALRYWVQTALDLGKPITIVGQASNEQHPDEIPYNDAISQRRADVAKSIVCSVTGANVVSAVGNGQTTNTTSLASDRVAIVTGTAKTTPSYMLTGTLSRPAGTLPKAAAIPAPTPPGPPANKKPAVLRRLSVRIRLQRNVLVLAEISGEIDFETSAEDALRTAGNNAISNSILPMDTLGLTGTNAATRDPNPSPAAAQKSNLSDGLVDFTLNVTYDTATHDLTETLTLGASPADIDGLLRMTNASDSRLKNIFGAVLNFTPILQSVTTAIDPKSAGDWKAIAVNLGVPALIGGLNYLKTTEATLYGGELKLRENIPSGELPTTFTDASLTLDYGVSFKIDVNALNIHSTKPLTVRYKAVGVNLSFGDPPDFKFVLDTSKGYSLDLSDPGLFKLSGALDKILKIAAARIAQFNPLTLELDAEIKADIGIITVDNFKIKIPLDETGEPMIVPSGVHVNIPSTLLGSGSVNIHSDGFAGTIDLTLVPLKLRIAASVGVEHIRDSVQTSREATAFFLGLEADFTTPLVLGSFGLFGLFGLFGMHYDRKLDPKILPNDPVGPDLNWLMNSNGKPYMLSVGATTLWEPKIDNWSFGVGAVLGSLDGYLVNLRGMVIFQLPGPRLLATANVKIIKELPQTSSDGMDAKNLDVGIIGILDLDFNLDQITIGVMIDLEIQSLLSVQVPIQIFFNWDQSSDWHLWIGTMQVPASATILGIVRGGGYFMIGGRAISPFPPGSSLTLPGVAVAMGVSAGVVWGDEGAGIYLKLAMSADFGVSFVPHLFIIGHVHLEGELRLVVVSIGASGDFLLTGPNPVYLEVHICGHVKLFFFKISACVDFTIGTDALAPPPPALIAKMYLQSFAPVIASGQGGDRPIDASLGDAILSAASGLATSPTTNLPALPTVPIDSVPVLQMQFGVDTSAITPTSTFTSPVPACPTYPGGAGVSLGGGRHVRYALTKLEITPPVTGGIPPPTVWRPNKPGSDTSQTQVDLALFSRNPNVSMSALERSNMFTQQLSSIWVNTCGAIAKPVCVLWSFCGQRLGPSPRGWTLYGTPWTDLPNTRRDSPVPTEMLVEQPVLDPATVLFQSLGLRIAGTHIDPAQVIGANWSDVVALLTATTPDTTHPELGIPHLITQKIDGHTPCTRALEIPRVIRLPHMATLIDSSGAGGLGGSAPEDLYSLEILNRWLRFSTGQANRVRLLLGVDADTANRLSGKGTNAGVTIRELTLADAWVRDTPLTAMLPAASWLDPTGPWVTRVQEIAAFLLSQHLVLVFVELVPQANTTKIEIAIRPAAKFPTLPPISRLVVGAIEVCPASETDRYQNAVQVQQSTIATINAYLDGGTAVPLLEKDTTYTIRATYNAVVTEEDGTSNQYPSNYQEFQFKTDSQPPVKLDPWVLCSSPDMGERHVFFQDPVQILFNDKSIFELFAKYGYQLRMNLHAADGYPEPSMAPVSADPIPGIGQATYDSMRALAASGALACIGATTQYQNQIFTAPVQLRPLMAYTLDLVTNPAQIVTGDTIAPLYRRAFSTSKYASMAALAKDLGVSVVKHRALTSKLGFILVAGKTVVPDQDIQDAFVIAGEQALPAPSQNSIVIYWAQNAGTGPYRPHAILLDCTEPLWRTRAEPSFQQPDPKDPSFKMLTISPAIALEVRETLGSTIGGFIVSPSGTRTVALFANGFAPSAQGTAVTLALHRPQSACYSLMEETERIIALPIAAAAPWEDDHV
jgi:hypothetical protein